jgi:acylaminoacyl-peptidase
MAIHSDGLGSGPYITENAGRSAGWRCRLASFFRRRSIVTPSRRFGLALCAALLLPRAALQAQPAPPLKAEDAFELELATGPRISPDGRRVVYVRQFADVMTDRRYSNLWLVGTDGKDQRPLTTGKQNDGSPCWSPDGTRIAYVSQSDGAARSWSDTWIAARRSSSRTSTRSLPA